MTAFFSESPLDLTPALSAARSTSGDITSVLRPLRPLTDLAPTCIRAYSQLYVPPNFSLLGLPRPPTPTY